MGSARVGLGARRIVEQGQPCLMISARDRKAASDDQPECADDDQREHIAPREAAEHLVTHLTGLGGGLDQAEEARLKKQKP